MVGVWIMALSISNSFITIVGPLTITVLILFVSGIPMLERKYAERPDFEAYKKRRVHFSPFPQKQIYNIPIWDIYPKHLCRKHLLAENGELQKLWNILTIHGGKGGYSHHPDTVR